MGRKRVDVLGRRYGALVVIVQDGATTKGELLYLCRCDCGKEKRLSGTALGHGYHTSCGCGREKGRKHALDIAGQRFGRYTVLERSGSNRFGQSQWLCRCECGTEKVITGFLLAYGQTQSCGCLGTEQSRENLKKANEVWYLPQGIAARNRMFNRYSNDAKRRGRPFTLSMEDFVSLTQQACHYCGALPTKAHKSSTKSTPHGFYYANGIDRLDNAQGYTVKNAVPCCMHCNRAKGTMTCDDFLAWLERCYEHLHQRAIPLQ